MPSLRASGGLRASASLRGSARLRTSGGFRTRRASRLSRSSSRPAGLGGRRKSRSSLRFTRLRSSDHDESLQEIVSGTWDDDTPSTLLSNPKKKKSEEEEKENNNNTSSSTTTTTTTTTKPRPDPITIPACSIEASSITFNAAIRSNFNQQIPRLTQTTLGKDWSVDIIAFIHNSIRLECCDLLDILTSMLLGCEGGKKTSVHELRAFFAWFSTFEAFLISSLKSEEDIIYPWLEQWGRIEGALSTGSRISVKGSIVRNIRDTSACSALLGFHHLPAGGILNQGGQDPLAVGFVRKISQDDNPDDDNTCKKVLNAVITQVIKFMQELIAYFKEQEDALPKIIESLYEKEDVKSSSIIKRMVKATWKISSSGKRDELIVVLVRGLGANKTFARNWVQTNLRHIDRLSLPIWRRKYLTGRGAVVEKFRARKKRFETLLELHGRLLLTYESPPEKEDLPRTKSKFDTVRAEGSGHSKSAGADSAAVGRNKNLMRKGKSGRLGL